MKQKLTLVVTCTDRKSASPSENLRFGNLPPGSPTERLASWRTHLRGQSTRHPLRKLYQGDAWRQALRLEAQAFKAGFEPTMLVASAGLGVVGAESEWPSYAATFSPGHVDSVGANREGNQHWWSLITKGQSNIYEWADGPTLFVLSQTYATAMAEDLKTLSGREDVLVFGGSDEVPDYQRIRADSGLRRSLGGTSTSLNLRTASAWLENLDTPTLEGHHQRQEWSEWVIRNRQTTSYNRRTLSDGDVLAFLSDLMRVQPGVSKTRALRIFRDSGLACEQKRFGGLFERSAQDRADNL